MTFFFKNRNIVDNQLVDCNEPCKETPEAPEEISKSEPEKEWVWVEGYKGTDKDMKCRDFQFEIGKEYSLLEGQDPIECTVGFHLCLNLSDVFHYYDIGKGHRFFKVRALVLKKDAMKYGDCSIPSYASYASYAYRIDKLVSKSIIFIEELSADEILKDSKADGLPIEYQQIAIESSPETAINEYKTDRLKACGYCEELAKYCAKNFDFNLVYALGKQDDMTMYEKLSLILK